MKKIAVLLTIIVFMTSIIVFIAFTGYSQERPKKVRPVGATGRVTISGPLTVTLCITNTFTANAAYTTPSWPLTWKWGGSYQPLEEIATHVTYTDSDSVAVAWDRTGTQYLWVDVFTPDNPSHAWDYAYFTTTVTNPVTITSVLITGPYTGTVGTSLILSSTVSPLNASQPFTVEWKEDGQYIVTKYPVETTNDTLEYTPNTIGLKDITSKWSNVAGSATGLHEVEIYKAPTIAPVSAVISGPISGTVGVVNTYTANVSPTNSTLPISYTWLADGQNTITNTAVLSISNSVAFTWNSEGHYTVTATAKNTAGSATSDAFTTTISEEKSFTTNRPTLNYGSTGSDNKTGEQTLFVDTTGSGTVNWSAEVDAAFAKILEGTTGKTPGNVTVGVDPSGLNYSETFTCTLRLSEDTSGAASDISGAVSPATVIITLKHFPPSSDEPPFGVFDTPAAGATVQSSIPVTGWALDDVEVASVKIYRMEGDQLAYIGDATFVDDARSDVYGAFPDSPRNYRGGWGYMLLTYGLPHGDGTYTLHAIATDSSGQQTTLGTKTISVDNANAVKPFGAIDTPSQGGTAAGSSYINWGWLLTPQPNTIPTDGSTIDLYIDGINLQRHPTYNLLRSDIATDFPGYNNSNGAVGYYYLDTTAYTNGVHTIGWSAEDNAGNIDGIGSRFWSIYNYGSSSSELQATSRKLLRPQKGVGSKFLNLQTLKIQRFKNSASPAYVIKGYNKEIEPEDIYPDGLGLIRIEIKECELIEIHLGNPEYNYSGYLVIGDHLRALPIGSTLDTQNGIFYWLPGPGFIGDYEFVLLAKNQENKIQKKTIMINIGPRFIRKEKESPFVYFKDFIRLLLDLST